MSNAATCVIVNPSAGRGRATQRLEHLRHQLGPETRFLNTQLPGHAEELALEAASTGSTLVAAAGGDGTVHEVANGILRANRPETALAILPIGSANDYADSLRQPSCWITPPDPSAGGQVDVGLVRDTQGRQRYFINSLGLGFNGAVTLESRKINRLQGPALYGLAVVRALWYRFDAPEMEIAFDGVQWRGPTLALSLGIGRREGNFVLAPEAKLDDGLFDFLHAGQLDLWQLMRLLPGVLLGHPPSHPSLRRGRCRELVLRSTASLTVHVDGEFFCSPRDEVRQIAVTLLPRRLRVLPW